MHHFRRYYLGALAISLGYGMLPPLAPGLLAMGTSTAVLGLLTGIYPLAKAFGYAACANQRLVRLPPKWALACAAASYALMALWFAPGPIFAARLVEGFFFGWYLASASIALSSQEGGIGRSLSLLNSLSSAGVLLGPLLVAGAQGVVDGQSAFLIAALLCVAAACVARFDHPPAEQLMPRLSFRLDAQSILIMAGFFLFDFTYGLLSVLVPVLFLPLGRAGSYATASLFTLGFVIFAGLMPLFARRHEERSQSHVSLAAVLVIALCFAALSFATQSPGLFAAILLLEFVAAAAAYSGFLERIGRLRPGLIPLSGIVQSLAMAAGATVTGAGVATLGARLEIAVLAAGYGLLALMMRLTPPSSSSARG